MSLTEFQWAGANQGRERIQRQRRSSRKIIVQLWGKVLIPQGIAVVQSPHNVQLFMTTWIQHTRLPFPSPSPAVCPSSCPLNWWCHPTISSSVAFFSFCLQSFPASGSLPLNQLFASGGQSSGPSASVLPKKGWCPLGLISLILLSKLLSGVFPHTTVWKHQSSVFCLLYFPALISIHNYWKDHNLN